MFVKVFLWDAGFTVLPIFTYAMADKNLGAFGVEAALEKFCFLSDGTPCVDGMIRLAGMFNHGASSSVMRRLRCPVIKPICSYSMTVDEWRENPDGTIADVAWSIALPELDGVIEPMFIGAQEKHGEAEHRVPVESRVKKLVRRNGRTESYFDRLRKAVSADAANRRSKADLPK